MTLRLRVLRVLAVHLCLSGVAAAQPKSDADRAEALNQTGKERIAVVDFEGAAKAFREAIALEPEARYYYNLCFTLEKLDRLAEARAACEVARKDEAAPSALRDKATKLVARIDERARGGSGPSKAPTTLADGEVVAQPPRTVPQPVPPPQPAATAQPVPATAATSAPVAAPTVATPAPETPAEAPRAWGFGARGGIGLATLDGGVGDAERRNGLAGGVILLLRLHPAISLQTEASYAQKGAEYSQGDDLGLLKVKIHLNYLELPVLLRLASPGDGFRPYGIMGVGAGVLLKAKLEARMGLDEPIEGDTDTIKKIDVGWIVGLGMELPAGGGRFGLEARYWLGLSDIEDSEMATIKNRVVTIAGSYLF